MAISCEDVINATCSVLKLNKDEFVAEKRNREFDYQNKHMDGWIIAVHIMRNHVLISKTTGYCGTNPYKPTYQHITALFKRKWHGRIMNWELDCKVKLMTDSNFKEKYNKVLKTLQIDYKYVS